MRRGKFVDFPDWVKWCISNDETREDGAWDTSTQEGQEGLEEFVAMLERQGFEIVRYPASPHQILNYQSGRLPVPTPG